MWMNRALSRYIVEISHTFQMCYVFWAVGHVMRHVNKAVRVSKVEFVAAFNFGDIFSGQLNTQGLDVDFKLFNLAATEDGNKIGSLCQDEISTEEESDGME